MTITLPGVTVHPDDRLPLRTTPRKRRPLSRLLLVTLVVLTLAATGAGHSVAAAGLTLTATSTLDSHDAHPGDGVCADATGTCTLRAAIEESNAQPAGSTTTVILPAGTYGLTLGELDVTANTLHLQGAGSSVTLIDGQHTSRVLQVFASSTVSVLTLTITDGAANGVAQVGGAILNSGTLTVIGSSILSSSASDGGGLANNAGGTVTLVNSSVSQNFASDGGGGLVNDGKLTLTNSTVSGNEGYSIYEGGGGLANNADGTATLTNSTVSSNNDPSGGGLINQGVMTLSNSSVISNSAWLFEGGGIVNGGTLTVTNSTISTNSAPSYSAFGGGIENGGTLTLSNSSVISNSAGSGGGGLANAGIVTLINSTVSGNSAAQGAALFSQLSCCGAPPSHVVIAYSTLSDNTATTAGGALFLMDGAPAVITGSILAANTPANCATPMPGEGQGYNLDSGTSCGFTHSTDITNTDPLLGPLANNGGPTLTQTLRRGSPAIDHGGHVRTGCPVTDQRGMVRPDPADGPFGACDMGAFESSYYP